MTATDVDVEQAVLEACRRAKVASRALATATRATKDAALEAMADALVAQSARILAANARTLSAAGPTTCRLACSIASRSPSTRIAAIADALRFVATLPDPVGEIRRGSTLPNGLRLIQKQVPLGVVGMIYEARPNVTVDAAALALKSGNAAVLARRLGAAAKSNEVDRRRLARRARVRGPAEGRRAVHRRLRPRGRPRAHERKRPGRRAGPARRPRAHPASGARLDRSRDRDRRGQLPRVPRRVGAVQRSIDIVLNSKTHRVGVCNAAETLLVHKDAAPHVLPAVLQALADAGVTLHVDPATASSRRQACATVDATDEDYATEYLSLDLAVKIVDDLDEALAHIRRFSTGHTEAIVTDDIGAADRFVAGLDSAAIMVNASTRFTDGGEFGLGAEIGISTQKLHARGPMGLAELTTTTWIAYGDGHVRG